MDLQAPSTPFPFSLYEDCTLCPRQCHADRRSASPSGFCGCGHVPLAARAALHHWEEPCISGPAEGPGGSGTLFFSGCTLGCRFCQNHTISRGHYGRELTVEQLAQCFLRLQDQGAYNINLVTPTQFLPHITAALDQVRHKLTIPVVYNCGGYERVETVRALDGYVDIWLPDLKYKSSALSADFSLAPDYFAQASEAIKQMIRQTGAPRYRSVPVPGQSARDSASPSLSLLASGVIIRHLALPSHREDSIALLHWIREELEPGTYLLSLMSQYTPYHPDPLYPELNRRITSYEYDRIVDTAVSLGLTEGFMQKRSSAREEYTPPFDLEGLEQIP